MDKSEFLIVLTTILFISVMAISTLVLAKSDGIAGYSIDGCTCHSSTASLDINVSISGPTIVIPSTSYTFTVTVAGGPLASNGLDVSVTDGTLVVTDPTNTVLLGGEIVQTVAGTTPTDWSFNWTTPSAYGNVTMYVAGLSGDGDGRKDADDLWNTASLTITVTIAGDVDGDLDVDYDDFIILAGNYGTTA